MSKEKVKIELAKSEAIVLFEFVSAFTDEEKLEIKDSAEEKVLRSICADLEKILVESSDENYEEILAKAREDVTGNLR